MTGKSARFPTTRSAGSFVIPALLCVIIASPILAQQKGTSSEILDHLGLSRSYLLHLPSGEKPTEPSPLIIALHGATMNGRLLEGQTELSQLSDQTGEFTVVYPNADPKGGAGFWDFFSNDAPPEKAPRLAEGRDDVGFIAALIDNMVDQKIAAPNRVFLTGLSNGAFMINRLTFSIPEKIAAIAPVAGTIPLSMIKSDDTPPPMPIIYFHGTKDRYVGLDGTDIITSARMSFGASAMVQWWAERNGLDRESLVTEELPDTSPGDECRVTLFQWKSDDVPVMYYQIEGGGHTWPGGSPKQPERMLGKICFDIDASELMWEFFKQHPKEK